MVAKAIVATFATNLLPFLDCSTSLYCSNNLCIKYVEKFTFSTVKNMQWYHLYVSRGLIKPIKSAFINKSNTKFSCPISLIKSVTKTNIKILISDIYGAWTIERDTT